MKRRKTKISTKAPFTIHAVTGVYDENPMLTGWVNYHTHGLVNYGLTELSIVCPNTNDTRPTKILNSVGGMMINGEEFDVDAVHCIDSGNITRYRFELMKTTCFGEESIRIILSDINSLELREPDSVYTMQVLDIFTEYENI